MLKTVVVKVRVTTPSGDLAAGVSVEARLQNYGVDPEQGLLDRSRITATTGADGVAVVNLWPNLDGTTDVQYRITARNSNGSKLLDEQVSVPDTDDIVWLHDILMLPAPSAKPYDEAAIEAIIANKVEAKAAAAAALVSETNAKESETNAKASELVSVKVADDMQALYGDALDIHDAALGAKASADAASQSELNAKASEENAKESELASKASEVAAGLSETNSKASEVAAEAAAQEIQDLYGDVSGIHDDALASAASAAAASQSEVNSKGSEQNAKASELAAKASEDASKASETAAALSETNATASEAAAGESATAAAASAAAALVSEQNAKASELATQAIADTVSADSSEVLDAISAATAAANAANSSATVANSGARAAYDAADAATAAAQDSQAAATAATGSANAATTAAETATTRAEEAKNIADAAATTAGQASTKVAQLETKFDALPTDYASPEEVAAMKADVADLKTTFEEANLDGIAFSEFGKRISAGANASAVREIMELGTAAVADIQSGAYDSAQQKLMSTGAFGLGGYIGSMVNMNNAMTGFYSITATDEPESGTHDYNVLHLLDSETPTQLWFTTGADIKLYARSGTRSGGSTTWSTFAPLGGGSGGGSEETEAAISALQASVDSLATQAYQHGTDIQALKTAVGSVNVVDLKSSVDTAISDIADLKAGSGGGGGTGSDPRVDEITPFGWSVAKAADADAAKTLLEIVDPGDAYAPKADFDLVKGRVSAAETAITNAQETATNAGTAAAGAQTAADQAQATADTVAAQFADSNVNALRTQVQSLDTNVESLSIRVDHLDGDGAIDVADLDAKVDSITTLGWDIIKAATAAVIKTKLGLGTGADAAVQTSQIDKTVNSLLKVGAFGLGGYAVPVLALNAYDLVNGFYYIKTSTATNPSDLPIGGDDIEYVVLQVGNSTTSFIQVAYTLNTATSRMFVRRCNGISGSSWTAWSEPGGGAEIAALTTQVNNLATTLDSVSTTASNAATAAATANQGVTDVNARVDALANASGGNMSSLGATLVAKNTTAEMRTVMELGTASQKAAQTTTTDNTAGSMLMVGAFGLGSTGNVAPAVSIDYTTMPSGLYTFTKGGNAGTFPGNSGTSTTQYGLLHLNGGQFSKGGLQFCATEYNASSIYARKATGANTWSTWVDILAPATPASYAVGAYATALVASTTGGTLVNGQYTTIPGSSLSSCALDGVTLSGKAMSGNWRQMSYADFASATPSAKVALFMRIA